MVSSFPTGEGKPEFGNDSAAVDAVLEVISAVRGVRSQAMVPPREELAVVIKPHSVEFETYIRSMADEITRLGRVSELVIDPGAQRPSGSAVVVGTAADCFVVIGGERIAAEVVRLQKDVDRARKDLEKFDAKLGNQAFVANASLDVVDEVREKADATREVLTRLRDALTTLGA